MGALRLASILVLLAACGSTTAKRDQSVPADGLVPADLAIAEEDMPPPDLGVSDDLGAGRDFTVVWDLGGIGAACRSTCECGEIMGCFKGICVPTCALVLCCTRNCISNFPCENEDGSKGTCGGGDMGGRDLGGSPDLNPCGNIDCRGGGVELCQKVGCAACVPSGSMMVCSR